MRVGIDVTPLLGPRTGIGQVVAALLDALPGVDDPPDLAPYVLSRRAGTALPPGAVALPWPATLAVRTWARVDHPRVDRRLGGVDVLHATNFAVPPLRRGARFVTVHDCWCVRHPTSCRPDVVAASRVMGRALRRGAVAHVATHFMAEEVADLFGAGVRTVRVPFGVPALDPAPGPALPAAVAGRPFVLAIGAVDPRKNLDGAVRAFGLPGGPAALDADLLLVLAGPDGAGRPAVDEAVAALPPAVAARVVLLGPVDDPTRAALLRAARVLAYPSHHEGFGFPVLEAMTAGVPVVASTAGALPEVAGDAAVLVAPGDDDALAAALVRLLTDDAERARFVALGRERAAGHSWAACAAGLVAAWREAAT